MLKTDPFVDGGAFFWMPVIQNQFEIIILELKKYIRTSD